MYILGLNIYHGDSSACIIKDGEVIVASEEERFRRIKHWAGFPSESIRFCLQDVNISISEIDHITVSRDTKANFFKKIKYVLTNGWAFKNLINRFINSKKITSIQKELEQEFNVSLSSLKLKIHEIEHHRSHLASAFFASSFSESALLSIDGFGDFTSTMMAVGKKNKINVIESLNFPHSLGIFYTAATQFLGFLKYGDEYKVMGLAPYGKPIYKKQFASMIRLLNNGFFKLNTKYFQHAKSGVDMSFNNQEPHIDVLFTSLWSDLFGEKRSTDENINQFHMDFASSVQAVTEEVIFHIVNHLHKKTGLKNLCLAGGVAQNSVANGKILLKTPFKQIYIPSAGHDAGTSIGSAYYLYNHIFGNARGSEVKHAYFGAKPTSQDIMACIEEYSLNYIHLKDEDLFKEIVKNLINGGVVGWFQGRAEFGPRALGHRSILADPRRKDAKSLINKKIKMRENFRPFAPSILKEYVSDYFESSDNTPFMEKVFKIKEDKRSQIPAVTHVDGTGRLQTVDFESSPRYYALIDAFRKKTGIPILLNTSFNENEPIVNSVDDAVKCFLRTKMDILVLSNIIITR
ncbi:MAG: carbamoyltransferase C-terminal domain-containing protein [Bacteroidota bacterium]|nr:carbamoyltransferase C-terminal domain-containing protein [Bacteroidota bacterium]